MPLFNPLVWGQPREYRHEVSNCLWATFSRSHRYCTHGSSYRQSDVVGSENHRFLLRKNKTDITPFKVIQGRQFQYQSKVRLRLVIKHFVAILQRRGRHHELTTTSLVASRCPDAIDRATAARSFASGLYSIGCSEGTLSFLLLSL